MNELPLIFLGGLLGSGHCLGMCGGFAVAFGSSAVRGRHNLLRQLIYTSGRVFTYAVLGAAVGFAGVRLTHASGYLAQSQAALAILAGILLVGQGLCSAGAIPWRARGKKTGNCLATTWFAVFLRARGLWPIFCTGLMTGFLPCGLVYSFLTLAAASGDVLGGMSRMAAFGMGTAPAMILAGCGASALGIATRRTMIRLAAWSIVLAGAISLARGGCLLAQAGQTSLSQCPLCQ